jgi:TRAP-type mannitol/chloroaromatic compound transport system substrate-binding protein
MVDGRLQITSPRKARIFPPDVLLAAWQAATDLYDQTAAKNKKFKRGYKAYMAFRNPQYLWRQVAGYPYGNFTIRQRAKG